MTRRLFAFACLVAASTLSRFAFADPPGQGTELVVAAGTAHLTVAAPPVFTQFENLLVGSVPLSGSGSTQSMLWSKDLFAPGGLFVQQRDYALQISRPSGTSFSGGSASISKGAYAGLAALSGGVQAIVSGFGGSVIAEVYSPGESEVMGAASFPIPAGATSFTLTGYQYLYLRAEAGGL